MKTLTYYSEKGGVGKSTFTIMNASWFMHNMGMKVAVADFNDRITMYRKAEIKNREKFIKENPDTDLLPLDEKTTWPIINCTAKEIINLKKSGIVHPYAYWFENEIKEGGRLHGYDIILCDFPGSITGGEFVEMYAYKFLSEIVIPTEKDQMTLNSMMKLCECLKGGEKDYCIFINKAQLGMKNFRNTYFNLGKLLISKGFPVLPDMISYSERILTIDKVNIIRSTFSFPDFNSPEFNNGNDLGIINLFIDVARELRKRPDIEGTEPVDMSFVDELEKTDDGRQLKGTPFPDYEI